MAERRKVLKMEIWIRSRPRKRLILERLIRGSVVYPIRPPDLKKKKVTGTIKEMNFYWKAKKEEELMVVCPFCRRHQLAIGLISWGECKNPKCQALLHFSYNLDQFTCFALGEFLEAK